MTYSLPVYRFKGKDYKTVAGLLNALSKDCGADEFSPVRNGRITAWKRAEGRIVGTYLVSPPKAGEPMRVERI